MIIRVPASQNSLGCPSLRVPSQRAISRILFPRISGKQKRHSFLPVILTDTHCRATPYVAVSGMRTDSAYGHARPPHPCRFAVLVHAGGCWFPGRFRRWPVAVYAAYYARVTAARCGAVEPRQRWPLLCGHIGPHPAQVDLCACL